MKLISMTDFVLEQNKNIQWSDTDNLETIIHYAEFLKQPLELWMFVPCDENGNVLKEPNRSTHTDIECEQYKQAKERCLFEGFKIKEHAKNDFSICDENEIFHLMWKFSIEEYWRKSKGITIIEDLVNYNLELTPTAIKQLGL